MFALQCQKKFQVVQSVTALFVLRGRGRAGVRPSLQVDRRTRRDTLWRTPAAGQQGKRSAEQACFARPGRRRRRGEQPEGSEAGRGSGQAPATLQSATRSARAFEAKPPELYAERKGRADTLGQFCRRRAAGKVRRRAVQTLAQFQA